ncbi:MAG: DUF4920 domain-containing protein [Deltaproteobacteria bacterium]|nr:MAG: DUF4920 domain-containing protein [Deltaproteobacteria bacterium]
MRTNRLASLLPLAVLASALLAAERASVIPAGEDFGAGLTLRQPTALSEVVRAPERYAQRPILLHGRLTDVCQRKGCWTILQDGSAHVRVRFRDYGFFVPTDAIGAEAFVEGVVKVETLSEKAARHYESESRTGDPESVDGPRREVGFVATGVRLVGRE